MINVLVVDDHEMVLEGMRNMLSRISQVKSVVTTTAAMDALQKIKSNEINIAFIDINMPDIGGIELCLKIKKEFPTIQVIALSSFAQRSYVAQMIANGATGYLLKSADKQEIEDAILAVMKNEMYISKQVGTEHTVTVTSDDVPKLTRREKEILVYISKGMTNKDIAQKIFVSQSTVDSHRKNLLAKFNVQNVAALISVAAKNGVLD